VEEEESVRFRRGRTLAVEEEEQVARSGGGDLAVGDRLDDREGVLLSEPTSDDALRGEVGRRVRGAGVEMCGGPVPAEELPGFVGVLVSIESSSKYLLGGARMRRGRSSSQTASLTSSDEACPFSPRAFPFTTHSLAPVVERPGAGDVATS
jgi:hypothetical protein